MFDNSDNIFLKYKFKILANDHFLLKKFELEAIIFFSLSII